MNAKIAAAVILGAGLIAVVEARPLWASPLGRPSRGAATGHSENLAGDSVASPAPATASATAPKAAPAPAPAPAAPPPDCGQNAIAQAMRDVFPPAADEVRGRSAETLQRCRPVGAEGVLAAALNQGRVGGPIATDSAATLAIAHALATFRSPVALTGLRDLALAADRPVALRAVALPPLAANSAASDALVALLGNVREDERLRLTALDLLTAAGRPPDPAYLAWLKRQSAPQLRKRAEEMLATRSPAAATSSPPGAPPSTPPASRVDAFAEHPEAVASPSPAAAATPPVVAAAAPSETTPDGSAPVKVASPAAPPPPPQRTGPRDGTPLAIGASTVAGGALMLNLSLLGFQDTTPQLLLGSAGAVIGFGTSWALSRFGVRPTMEQAAWFTNTTAWGTLAGITIYQGSGADNYKLRYFSLVAGEVTGMAAGVWSARRWKWTGEQIVMSDSLFLGAALAGLGVDRFRGDTPQVTPGVAAAVVPVMVAAAVAGHALAPSSRDVALMGGGAVGAGWVGGLLASGGARTDLFGSRQGQGGLFLGLGVGYLGGAAAGAFTEVAPLRLQMGGAGLLAGNAVGFGVNMLVSGVRRRDSGSLEPGDSDSWKLGAGIGGLAMGSAAFALAPRLRFGERALPMTAWGAGYGAGTYWLALAASHNGEPQNETTDAVLRGGLLATAVAGGVGGLLLSGGFAPDAAAQWTTFGATSASIAAAWGATALLVDQRGAADGVAVTAGAALGLSGGALFTHHARLRPPSLGAAAVGASYGTLLGALIPSLSQPTWRGDRGTGGAAMLGLGGGALLGATVGQVTGASAGQVAVPAVAGTLGLGAGTGAGLLFADSDSRPTRVGAAVGTASFLGGSILLDHWLHLSEGLGAAAPGMALVGGGFGAVEGAWLAGLLDDSGTVAGARSSTVGGGVLMGASAGIAGGLILSRRWTPPASQLLFASGNSLLLASAGYGLGELAANGDGRGTTAATMSGAAVGLIGGAAIAPHLRLTTPVVEGGLAGGAAAGLVGVLAPSLGADTWTDGPRTDGGLRLGLAAGLLGGGAAAQFTGASARETTAATMAAALGLGVGLGAGSMWPDQASTRPERIGTVVGVSAVGTAGALLMRPLHLAEPFAAPAGGLVLTTTAHGIFDGVLLAALLDPSGLPSTTPGHQLQGGALFGGSLGLGAGLLLAPRLRISEGDLFFMSGVTVAGASMGRGVALLAADQSGRADSGATLAGAVAGTAAGAWAATQLDAQPVDVAAALVGAGYGGLLGALVPSLADEQWPGWNRKTSGGLFLGAGAGAAAAISARLGWRADDNDVGLTALAGADGALTGVGWALLLGGDGDAGDAPGAGSTSQHLRLGAVAGTAAGLGLGMASWSRVRLGPGDPQMIGAAMALAAWNGLWIPALGHASSDELQNARSHMNGGLLAAAGTASFASTLLAPVVELDADAITDAVALDAVFTGAGAGVGALVSSRSDAPVAGMLAGGAAGLVLGGALHRRLELGTAQAPLLSMGAMEGLWFGAWAPYLLHPAAEITDGQRAGGVAAGTFGGLGLAALASTAFAPSAGDAGFAALGSGIGAAITGGVALMSDDIQDQQAVGLMLAGTGLGLGAGGYLAPRLHLDLRAAGGATVGGMLGTSEALLFAWSSRAEGGAQYAGAGLLGAGVGTALGLATSATMDSTGSGTPAIAGFTAWGAWMGAFAGSLFARDAHEITAGGLIGSNLGLLAGYGLLRTGAVDPGDFGWLSLFGAVGTVAGAAAGAPFASRGEPAPILGGLAVGPAVGMAVGALVLPRLRAARDAAAAPPTVAWRSTRASVFSAYSLSMRGDETGGADDSAASTGGDGGGASDTNRRSGPAARPGTSVEIARELQARHPLRRRFLRAVDASIRISDCAPLIGALPTPDAASGGTTSPLLVGLTGRWQ